MTPEQQSAQVARERALELAEQDLHAINLLLESPGWLYLQRRLNETRAAFRDTIADDGTLTDQQTRDLRIQRQTLGYVLRLPHTDRAAHQATMGARNMKDSGPARG